MIATTRMFGSPVGDIASIKEAVATYTSRAAEKLRRQHSAAKTISVFVVAKEENHNVSFNMVLHIVILLPYLLPLHLPMN